MQNLETLEGVYTHTQVILEKLNINIKIDRDTITASKM